jgi:membrane-associated protein
VSLRRPRHDQRRFYVEFVDTLQYIASFTLHIDQHLLEFFNNYGAWIFALLFLIVFCETGLVVTPFLPGDSLLFAVGALAAGSTLNVHLLALTLFIAAVLGDTVNYTIGRLFGKKLFSNPQSRIFRRDHLDRTHAFYEKHGGKTIVIARFVPIIRTFAPFVAGMGSMSYSRFFLFNIGGAAIWVNVLIYGGYLLGNLPIVKQNFTKMIFLIILLSLLPILIEYIRARRSKHAA